jgi:SAM-dependent methyltransferase
MSKQKILEAYEKLADKYNELIEHKPHNAYYDRPNTLSLLPELHSKKVLDAGCGPGKYAEILMNQGAEVMGLDISPKMVQKAKERNQEKGQFFVHDLNAHLHMINDASIDIVLSALAMDYLEDWNTPVKEFCRVLKPKGCFVFSVTHPFFDFGFFKSKKYFETEAVKCWWKGFGIPVEMHSYRRSLENILLPLTDNGFYIDKILEPKPVKEFEKYDPRHYKELSEFPSFMCVRAIKK